MKVQIFSDVHMEAYHDPKLIWRYVIPKAPVAIVPGDIHSKRFEDQVTEIASKFKLVVCTLGNHEWYGRDISWEPDLTKIPKNVVILNPGVHEYKDRVFIGATLWTDFKNQDWFVKRSADDGINDFHVIRNGEHRFTAHEAYEKHIKEKSFVKMMIEKYRSTDKKIVIVTHFMPSYDVVHERWKKMGSDTLNYYFSAQCNDLMEMDGVSNWICGHTHDYRDLKIKNCRIVANPLGYPGENRVFINKVINV